MTFPNDQAGRVSQQKYWALFGAYTIAVPALLIGGVVSLLQGSWGLGFLLVAGIVPLGIYWRVIMMRRCRDIGWPAFVPWLIFGLQVVSSFSLPIGPAAGATPGLALFAWPMVLGLVDFVVSIAIGCISSKRDADYAEVFGDGPADVRRTQPAGATGGPDRFDDAIARALEAHRRGESALGAAAPAAPRRAPAMPGRPAASFGRRVV